MALSGLLFLLWMTPAPIEPAGVGHCLYTECPFTGSTPAAQYRNLAACLTGPAVPAGPFCSCADLDSDGFVSLRDFAAYQIAPVYVCSRYLEVRQQPGLGFCPSLGTVYRANVIYALYGSLILNGSLIYEGDPATDRCLYFDSPLSCYVAKPFPPRRLTSLETAELHALIENIPQLVANCNYAFDPCVIWYVGGHNDYCFGDGNANEYREAIKAVAAYVSELAMDQP